MARSRTASALKKTFFRKATPPYRVLTVYSAKIIWKHRRSKLRNQYNINEDTFTTIMEFFFVCLTCSFQDMGVYG